MNIKIISAGAGSGKTYRLSSEMVDFLKSGVRPGGIIATTFTQKAAAEQEPPEGDVTEGESRPATKRKSPSEGKSKFWGHDGQSGRQGRATGRSRGSGHR